MRKRVILVLIAVAVMAAAIIVVVLVRHGRPPAATRLLPAADAYVYIDLATLRRGAGFSKLPKVELDPEYAEFVRETGFQFERDLDEAAFAIHLPPEGETNPEAAFNRHTGVFVARFDAAKAASYLHKIAGAEEKYRDKTVYAVSLPGRTVRVAILGEDLMAASNTEGPYVMQGIIDRQHQMASSTPDLLRAHYGQVPLGSLAWAVARVATPGQQRNSIFTLPGGFDLFFPPDTVVLASVRYLGSISLRAEAIAPNEEGAQQISDQLNAFVALFRTLETRAPGGDPDVKQFFDSLRVTQEKNRATVSATVPTGFVKKLLAEAPARIAPPPPEPKPTPQPAAPAKRGRRRR